jgi:hypothetical protein
MVAAEPGNKIPKMMIVNGLPGIVSTNGSAVRTLMTNGTTGYSAMPPAPADLEQSILETVAYADLFDYPLTAAEIHRYLYHWPVAPAVVNKQLENGRLVPRYLSQTNEFYTLVGREAIVATRLERRRAAHGLWPEARRYAQHIAQLPFVRMVAVTGSLAMGNVQNNADIDYLIVTADTHLWVCRAFVIALVRLAARHHIELCPNYFVSQRALQFPEQNLYTAHELVQMVPLFGLPVYDQMRQLNQWTARFLPNAAGPPAATFSRLVPAPQGVARSVGTARLLRTAGERMLRSPLGKKLERWEMKRKIDKFQRHYPNWQESDFSTDRCKGHFDNHQQRTLSQYYSRFSQTEWQVAGRR